MKNQTRWAALVVLGFVCTQNAHSSIRKTLTVILPGQIEANLVYQTVPELELDPNQVEADQFLNPWGPLLDLSGDIQVAGRTVPAGRYTVGLVRDKAGVLQLAFYPGRYRQLLAPVNPEIIQLKTERIDSEDRVGHLAIDITLGDRGALAGKIVLTFRIGHLLLMSPLS